MYYSGLQDLIFCLKPANTNATLHVLWILLFIAQPVDYIYSPRPAGTIWNISRFEAPLAYHCGFPGGFITHWFNIVL
jgi:hypothetical protein